MQSRESSRIYHFITGVYIIKIQAVQCGIKGRLDVCLLTQSLLFCLLSTYIHVLTTYIDSIKTLLLYGWKFLRGF